jgi:DNA-binding transcriptional LysR family regulator
MPLPDLDVLVAILDAGSMASAAQRLGMPRATLSRRLRRLEDEVGAVLVRRTTRQLAPTEAGLELYRHARPIVDAVETATMAVRARDDTPRGLLRVTMPIGANAHFADMVTEFLTRFPEVRVELSASTRHVDLIAEGYDVAIRAGQVRGASLIARRLYDSAMIAVASPAYLARRGMPDDPVALREHDCLVGFERGESPRRTWALLDGTHVPVRARFTSNDLSLLADAALRGIGIALLPREFVLRHLDAGTLVPVLPDQVGVHGGIWVVYPERRGVLPRVRAFIDHAVAWSRSSPLRP